ncbi:MAG: hypothetical protein FWE61_01760 [Micrococcales bacterium]|nr:hypothetical protein [Micrococcales bacterium]
MALRDSAWKEWYRARHDQLCLASGTEFEDYVTGLLRLFHPDYVNPDPMGSRGDGGCDGLAERGTILYACYGSRATTDVAGKARRKLVSDFARGLECWSGFTVWRFVTNALFGDGPTQQLVQMQQAHGPGSERPIDVQLWRAPDDLWNNVVTRLDEDLLAELIPGVPHAESAELKDIVPLIETLRSGSAESGEDLSTIRVVPATKMDYNRISAVNLIEFNVGRLFSRRIDAWFGSQTDPGLRDSAARNFRQVYEAARRSTDVPSEIVETIYAKFGSDPRLDQRLANAIYAVTAYFFDSCDIFEEPPADGSA